MKGNRRKRQRRERPNTLYSPVCSSASSPQNIMSVYTLQTSDLLTQWLRFSFMFHVGTSCVDVLVQVYSLRLSLCCHCCGANLQFLQWIHCVAVFSHLLSDLYSLMDSLTPLWVLLMEHSSRDTWSAEPEGHLAAAPVSPDPFVNAMKLFSDKTSSEQHQTQQISGASCEPRGLAVSCEKLITAYDASGRSRLVSSLPNDIRGKVGLKRRTDTDGLPVWNPIASLLHLMSY